MFPFFILSLAVMTDIKEAATELERKSQRAIHRAYYAGEELPNFSWIHESRACAIGGMADFFLVSSASSIFVKYSRSLK